MSVILRSLREFGRHAAGSVALTSAIALPALLIAGGVAADFAKLTSKRGRLQQLADATALAAAAEMRLGNARATTVLSVASAYEQASADPADVASISFSGSVPDNRTVQIKLTQNVNLSFGSFTKLLSNQISAQATARVSSTTYPICVIGLDQSATFSVGLDTSANLSAPNCSVYSDSTQANGLFSKHSALLSAGFICSAGGKAGGPGNYSPAPLTDCPIVRDPLVNRPVPPIGSCTTDNATISGGSQTLYPGTYCNSLTITKAAQVTLSPGIYIFQNGPLIVNGGASLQGSNVGLFFTGSKAVVDFQAASTISVTAPKAGTMAGILIQEDRSSPPHQKHQILSNNARTLLGTIYIPQGMFYVGANAPVADQSAYTIVVARQFSLSAGPTMVLNTNYSSTDIPVPAGVGPANGTTALVQ